MKGKGIILGFVLAMVFMTCLYFSVSFYNNLVDDKFEEGYVNGTQEGYYNGLLYTQQTGNITFIDNGELVQQPLSSICNSMYQQLNQ